MKKLLWTLFYLLIFSILVYNSFSYLDPDFGWHLRFGEVVWKTLSVPHDQMFMWPIAGQEWVDHEWLANLKIYWLWSIGGYILVTLSFALIPLATIALINYYLFTTFLKTERSQILLAILEIIILLIMRPHLGIRVQEVTLLGVAILLILLSQYNLKKRLTPPWWLPIFFYLWACLHAGFLFGLLILCSWLVVQVGLYYIPNIFPKKLTPLPKPLLLQWLLISGLSFIATLTTPYGFSLYDFLSGYQDTYYQTKIKEWLSPYVFPLHYGQIIFDLIVISSTMALYLIRGKKDLIFNYLVTGILLIMATKSVRHFPLLMVAWLILILPYLIPEIAKRITIPLHRHLKLGAALCLGIISLYALLSARWTTKPFTTYCTVYACEAVQFLKQHPQYTNRLLNPYNMGGYMIGVSPEIPLFIDGRLPQYQFGSHSILEEYYQFFNSDLLRKKLDQHEIKSVFYQKPTSAPQPDWFESYFLGYQRIQPLPSNLLTYLHSSSDWENVYEDDKSLIFIKKQYVD